MTNEKYKYDISKLKNYKILDSHFESPIVKNFVDCVLEADSEDGVIRCGNHYHMDEHDTEHEHFSVQSAGDSRCSGKSEILYLMFPSALKNTSFGDEEENPDNPTNKILKNEIYSIHTSYHPPSDDTLAIYVQRDPYEKITCLVRRGDEKDSDIPSVLPNELIENTQEIVRMYRENNIPQMYKQKNYIYLENMNIEKLRITDESTCGTANLRMDDAIEKIESELSVDKKIVAMGIYKDAHKKFLDDSVKSVYKNIDTTKEYADVCNLDNKYKRLESAIEQRRDIAKQHI